MAASTAALVDTNARHFGSGPQARDELVINKIGLEVYERSVLVPHQNLPRDALAKSSFTAPFESSDKPKRPVARYIAVQEWEGVIESVDEDRIDVVLSDVNLPSRSFDEA